MGVGTAMTISILLKFAWSLPFREKLTGLLWNEQGRYLRRGEHSSDNYEQPQPDCGLCYLNLK